MTAAGIERRPLSYVSRLESRPLGTIDLAVIHCTELPDLETARRYGERIHYPLSQTGNCGHYYLDRNGLVQEWCPPDRIAHHVRGYNERSVGIELVNRGRYPDWLHSLRQEMTEPYPEQQIDALSSLLDHLASCLPALQWICGHEELDTERVPASDSPELQVRRKRDPGPLFPWAALLRSSPLHSFLPAAPGA